MSGSLPINGGYAGAAWLQTGRTDYQAIDFLVRQIIAGKAFSAIVQVQSVTNSGGVAAAGTVSVQPMVNQVDGLGNQVPHGTIYNIPYMRLQGGTNAIIMDPAVGDIGLAVICDRDISVVKATQGISPPGSSRQHSWSDGCYFGGFLNGAPSQYIEFTSGGINIVSAGTINISSSGGTTIDGKPFLTHRHSGVQTGTGDTNGVV